MRTVGVVGARGYLGSALCQAFEQLPGHQVFAITRDSYPADRSRDYDILVNCAMPSARFWAKNNPQQDFIETVQKTADLVYGWTFQKFIQISTVSARCQLDTVYGRNKAAAESLCPPDQLIVRLGALYDQHMKKGVLVDLMQDSTVFVDGASRYCFAERNFIANWIAANTERKGIVEAGGKNAIALRDVARHIGSKSHFSGALDHQEVQNADATLPEASQVLAFMDEWKHSLGKTL